jgi:integrase
MADATKLGLKLLLVTAQRRCEIIAHFTPHDLRRTAASMMTSIGVLRLHVEKVLNHTLSDIAEVYDRHDYFGEKKNTLNRWADHLKTVIANKMPKVVPLHGHLKPERTKAGERQPTASTRP